MPKMQGLTRHHWISMDSFQDRYLLWWKTHYWQEPSSILTLAIFFWECAFHVCFIKRSGNCNNTSKTVQQHKGGNKKLSWNERLRITGVELKLKSKTETEQELPADCSQSQDIKTDNQTRKAKTMRRVLHFDWLYQNWQHFCRLVTQNDEKILKGVTTLIILGA